MTDETIYEIRAGVRRAKAAYVAGKETIPAQIGRLGPVIDVRIDSLRSPKDVIETEGIRGMDWGRILRATLRGAVLPPIEIMPGTKGIPIADVEVQEDEFDVLLRLTDTRDAGTGE